MKIKVCGMREAENIQALAELKPDYIGFIFYEKSPRFMNAEPVAVPEGIKKVGVFVDAPKGYVLQQIEAHDLDVIQLHGKEDQQYISLLRELVHTDIDFWKVFSVGEKFDFKKLKPFEDLVDAFLFDTRGEAPGGNGKTFDWKLLNAYRSELPIVISGGIGLKELPAVKELLNTSLPIMAIDVNSKFESAPGLKKIDELKTLMNYEL